MRRPTLLLAAAAAFLACAHQRYKPHGRPVHYEGYFATLPSGLRVVAYEVPQVDRFALTVSYGSGSAEDPAGREGLAHLVEHLAYRAVLPASGARVWDRLVALGVRFNGETSLDGTDYYAVGKPSDLGAALALEAARMREPLAGVSEDDFAIEREVVTSEYRERYETDPHGAETQWLLEAAFRGHPYARPVSGTPDTLRAVSLADARAWATPRYAPANAIVVVISPRPARDAARLVAEAFGEIEGTEGERLEPDPQPPAPAAEAALVTHTAPVPQPVVWVAWPVPGERAGEDPRGHAAATALGRAFLGVLVRSYGPTALQVVESVSPYYESFAAAGLVALRIEVARPGDVEKVAELARSAAFELRADSAIGSGTGALTQRERGNTILAVRDRLLVGGYTAIEEIDGRRVARFLRASGQPDYLAGWQKLVVAQLNHDIVDYVAAHLRRERSVAVAILPDRNAPARAVTGRVGPGGDAIEDLPDDSVGSPPPAEAALAVAAARGQPVIERRVLANGLTAIVAQRGTLPVAEVRLVLRTSAAGSEAIPAGLPALALSSNYARFAFQDLMTVGAENAEELGVEHVGYTTRGASANLDVLLQSTAEWGRDQRARYFDQVKDAFVRRVARLEGDPVAQAVSTLHASLFPDHPYGRSPRASELDEVRGSAASRWLGSEFRPERATLLVVSDQAPTAELWAAVERHFGGWRRGGVARAAATAPGLPAARRVVILDRPGASQALVIVGLRAPAAAERDPAATAAIRWLTRERLLRKIRMEEGVSYGVSVDLLERERAAALLLAAAVDRDAAGKSLTTLLSACRALARDEVTPVDAARARWHVAREFGYGFDTVAETADALAYLTRLGLPPEHYDRQPGSIAELSPGRIRAAAAALAVDREAVVILGDASVLTPQLRALGVAPEVRRGGGGTL